VQSFDGMSHDAEVADSGEVRERLRDAFVWRGDRTDDQFLADITGWWRDAHLRTDLVKALATLIMPAQPTVLLGPQSRGAMLAALVARELDIGMIEVRKDPEQLADSDAWVTRTTPPDYRDRHLSLGFRRGLLDSGDRVVLVDDWIETGGQATAGQALVEAVGATWAGAVVIVDGLTDSRIRRKLQLRSLLHVRDL
jgi:adenine phosphoribosyltransferase